MPKFPACSKRSRRGWRGWLDALFLNARFGFIGSIAVFALVLFMVFFVAGWIDSHTSARLAEWANEWNPDSTAGVVGRAVPADKRSAALGLVGAGGSFGFADPDARLGYAYVMNKTDYYLLDDPREKSLRDAVYRFIAAEDETQALAVDTSCARALPHRASQSSGNSGKRLRMRDMNPPLRPGC